MALLCSNGSLQVTKKNRSCSAGLECVVDRDQQLVWAPRLSQSGACTDQKGDCIEIGNQKASGVQPTQKGKIHEELKQWSRAGDFYPGLSSLSEPCSPSGTSSRAMLPYKKAWQPVPKALFKQSLGFLSLSGPLQRDHSPLIDCRMDIKETLYLETVKSSVALPKCCIHILNEVSSFVTDA